MTEHTPDPAQHEEHDQGHAPADHGHGTNGHAAPAPAAPPAHGNHGNSGDSGGRHEEPENGGAERPSPQYNSSVAHRLYNKRSTFRNAIFAAILATNIPLGAAAITTKVAIDNTIGRAVPVVRDVMNKPIQLVRSGVDRVLGVPLTTAGTTVDIAKYGVAKSADLTVRAGAEIVKDTELLMGRVGQERINLVSRTGEFAWKTICLPFKMAHSALDYSMHHPGKAFFIGLGTLAFISHAGTVVSGILGIADKLAGAIGAAGAAQGGLGAAANAGAAAAGASTESLIWRAMPWNWK